MLNRGLLFRGREIIISREGLIILREGLIISREGDNIILQPVLSEPMPYIPDHTRVLKIFLNKVRGGGLP